MSYNPPPNLLTIGDIYKDSENKQEPKISQTKTMSSLSLSVTMQTSTEKSSSYSVSSSSSMSEPTKAGDATSDSKNSTEKEETTPDSSMTTKELDPITPSTSTKIVKTVRVRHRMKSGSPRTASGNTGSSSLIRNKFRGPGRIRVVQRPVSSDDYMKNFPEFAAPEGESSLNEDETEQVKKALIELKRAVV